MVHKTTLGLITVHSYQIESLIYATLVGTSTDTIPSTVFYFEISFLSTFETTIFKKITQRIERMNAYLAESIILLGVGLLVYVLGRMRIINERFYIPLLLSSFIFMGFYGIKVSDEFLIPLMGFSNRTDRVLFYDYGNGLLGLLPLALALLYIGKRLLKMDYNEQWSGTTTFKLTSLKYGLIGGTILAAIPLIVLASMGQKFNYKVDVYRYGINGVTNLYEEVICRGLLLACCVKYWNRLSAVVWTSVVFGLAHGLTGKSITIALGAGIMAWAVLKAKSLWAGWTSHQLADVIVDTFLP